MKGSRLGTDDRRRGARSTSSSAAGISPPPDRELQLLAELKMNHVGRAQAIDQLALAELLGISSRSPSSRRRTVQRILDRIRTKTGLPILSTSSAPRGVFIAATPADAEEYLGALTRRILTELATLKNQRAALTASFAAGDVRSDSDGGDRSASGRPGAPAGKPRDSVPRISCRCGCGESFAPRNYNQHYLNIAHKQSHERMFYRIGRAVVEAGLGELFGS